MSLEELLGEELFEQVQGKLDEDTELLVNDGSYVPRDRLNEESGKVDMLEEQLEEAQTQLSERNEQLEQLKNDTQTSEELKSRIEELQQKNEEKISEYESKIEQKEQEYEQKLQQQKFDSKLELALRDAKAKNVKAVKALLETDEIKLDGDKLLGLEDQLSKLKKENDYLFGKDTLSGKEPDDGGGSPKFNKDPNDMTDAEYIEWRESQK